MEDKKKKELIEKITNLGKDDALEIAKALLDYYQVDLKGTEYIDELLEIGMDYDRFGEAEKALDMYFKAEKRALAIGDNYGLGTIYSNIGVVYNNTKDYNRALKYYEKALSLIQEVNNEQEIGILYNNLGYVYKNILKYKESVEYYLKSLKVLQKVGDKFSMTASYFNMAEVFAKLDDYESAIEYMDECIKIDKELELTTLKSDMKYREALFAKLQKQQGKEKAESVKVIVAEKNSETSKEEKKDNLGWFWGKKKQ